MILILPLLIPLSFFIGAFCSYKGVQLGLRWQVEVRQERPPTMDSHIKNPIEVIQQVKQDTEAKSLVSEWFNGAEESR